MENIREILNSAIPEDLVLDSIYEIEAVLEKIKEIKDSSEHLSGLKKYRNSIIDAKIGDLKFKEEALRGAIVRSMNKLEPKKSTIHFPPIGKVTKKKGKEDWEIVDEQSVLQFVSEQGVRDQVTKTEVSFVKSALNKMLDNFSDQAIKVPGVEKRTGPETLSITFEEDADDTPSTPVKVTKITKSKPEEVKPVFVESDF